MVRSKDVKTRFAGNMSSRGSFHYDRLHVDTESMPHKKNMLCDIPDVVISANQLMPKIELDESNIVPLTSANISEVRWCTESMSRVAQLFYTMVTQNEIHWFDLQNQCMATIYSETELNASDLACIALSSSASAIIMDFWNQCMPLQSHQLNWIKAAAISSASKNFLLNDMEGTVHIPQLPWLHWMRILQAAVIDTKMVLMAPLSALTTDVLTFSSLSAYTKQHRPLLNNCSADIEIKAYVWERFVILSANTWIVPWVLTTARMRIQSTKRMNMQSTIDRVCLLLTQRATGLPHGCHDSSWPNFRPEWHFNTDIGRHPFLWTWLIQIRLPLDARPDAYCALRAYILQCYSDQHMFNEETLPMFESWLKLMLLNPHLLFDLVHAIEQTQQNDSENLYSFSRRTKTMSHVFLHELIVRCVQHTRKLDRVHMVVIPIRGFTAAVQAHILKSSVAGTVWKHWNMEVLRLAETTTAWSIRAPDMIEAWYTRASQLSDTLNSATSVRWIMQQLTVGGKSKCPSLQIFNDAMLHGASRTKVYSRFNVLHPILYSQGWRAMVLGEWGDQLEALFDGDTSASLLISYQQTLFESGMKLHQGSPFFGGTMPDTDYGMVDDDVLAMNTEDSAIADIIMMRDDVMYPDSDDNLTDDDGEISDIDDDVTTRDQCASAASEHGQAQDEYMKDEKCGRYISRKMNDQCNGPTETCSDEGHKTCIDTHQSTGNTEFAIHRTHTYGQDIKDVDFTDTNWKICDRFTDIDTCNVMYMHDPSTLDSLVENQSSSTQSHQLAMALGCLLATIDTMDWLQSNPTRYLVSHMQPCSKSSTLGLYHALPTYYDIPADVACDISSSYIATSDHLHNTVIESDAQNLPPPFTRLGTVVPTLVWRDFLLACTPSVWKYAIFEMRSTALSHRHICMRVLPSLLVAMAITSWQACNGLVPQYEGVIGHEIGASTYADNDTDQERALHQLKTLSVWTGFSSCNGNKVPVITSPRCNWKWLWVFCGSSHIWTVRATQQLLPRLLDAESEAIQTYDVDVRDNLLLSMDALTLSSVSNLNKCDITLYPPWRCGTGLQSRIFWNDIAYLLDDVRSQQAFAYNHSALMLATQTLCAAVLMRFKDVDMAIRQVIPVVVISPTFIQPMHTSHENFEAKHGESERRAMNGSGGVFEMWSEVIGKLGIDPPQSAENVVSIELASIDSRSRITSITSSSMKWQYLRGTPLGITVTATDMGWLFQERSHAQLYTQTRIQGHLDGLFVKITW
jgi:hypothetical protein